MKILVINGPNLNLLGKRDKDQYGNISLEEISDNLKKEFPDISFDFYQSNIEGELINVIQLAEREYDGLIINPGGYAHTSVAIADALSVLKIPKVEVHLSHLVNREYYRQKLITAASCDGYVSGFKELSYGAAVYILLNISKKR
jgi:3-dehydroquinate dehydratase-2